MTQMTENSKSEINPAQKLEGGMFQEQYKKRFEEAVADAQHMLIYASSKFPKDIKKETLEKLINARHRVDNQQELTTKEEAEFWLAYQDIWKLVRPVTAESIKANLPYEKTSLGKIFGNVSILSRWFGKGNISKARGTVNRHINYTVFTLILLLILQIYWVIGNQLTTQAEQLSKQEADLTLELTENQREFSEIEIRYKQAEIESETFTGAYNFYNTPDWERDILNNITKKADLEKQLELLKSQLERSSAILGIWSGPWEWLIEEEDIQVSKYASEIKSIETEIAVIDAKEFDDRSGEDTARKQNALLDSLISEKSAEWDYLLQEYAGLDTSEPEIQSQLINYDQVALNNKNIELAGLLTQLERQKAENQANIDLINQQITNAPTDGSVNIDELNTTLGTFEAEKTEIQTNIDAINSQLLPIQTDLETILNLQANLDYITARRIDIQNQVLTLQTEIESLRSQQVTPEQIVIHRNSQRDFLNIQKNALLLQEQAEKNREQSSQTQLAGQFVLVVLQSYMLPLLYGILGARTSVLRTLSKQVEKVTFSESAGIQHVLRISLGALAGIMVGWFSFLIDSSTFFGSVSPLAIAFLVGYNIELFFSLMDLALNRIKESSQQSAQASENTAQPQVAKIVSDSAPVEEIQIQTDEPPASQPTS